jgi:NAD(P)-dependent dehydrogenase (short-subunit alcohol dehydrogenase family)
MPVRKMPLSGKRAVVTGGRGGLGQAIVDRLQTDGARVAVFDRAEATPGNDLLYHCDVTNKHDVSAAVAQVVGRLGGIEILVNTAGLQGEVLPIAEASVEGWRRVIDVNLTGAFICSKAIAPIMVAAGWGRIIHISSVQGKEGTAQSGAYAASKAGLIALGKTQAKELATTGVTVNCVTPTVVETGMIHEISERRREELLAHIPMGRWCQATEVAAMVAWIASEECSFSTGAVFDISGGRSTW